MVEVSRLIDPALLVEIEAEAIVEETPRGLTAAAGYFSRNSFMNSTVA